MVNIDAITSAQRQAYLGVMQHVELLRRVAARVQQDRLFASGVVRQEAGHVQNLVADDHPAVVLLVVLRYLFRCPGAPTTS